MAATKRNKGGRKKGTPKTGGRQKGTPNKITVEVRRAAEEFTDDPSYRRRLMKDWRARKVSPAMETLIWHYAKGKPIERTELGAPGDFDERRLTDAELKHKLEEALASL